MRDYLRVSSWGYPYGIVVLDVLALGLDCLASLCRLASMFCLGGIFSVMGTVSGHADLPSPRGRFSAGVDQQGAKLKYSFCACCLDTPVP